MEAAAKRTARAVVDAFYRAIRSVAEAHADDPFVQASAFASGPMHDAVIAAVLKDLAALKLDAARVKGILDQREGEDREASYDSLTGLFVDAKTWVKEEKPKGGREAAAVWVQVPLTPEQQDDFWKSRSKSVRTGALMARYAETFGKTVRPSASRCQSCDGRGRSGRQLVGRIIVSASGFKGRNAFCRTCRGVGIVRTVRYR